MNGTTTGGSSPYPRSELREMDGTNLASWSSQSGYPSFFSPLRLLLFRLPTLFVQLTYDSHRYHRLEIVESFNHLPIEKSQVVGAQIHDSDDGILNSKNTRHAFCSLPLVPSPSLHRYFLIMSRCAHDTPGG